MPRLLPPPAHDGPPAGCSISRIPVRVRFAETDLMGIVHHSSYLLYFEVARVEYLRRRGATYTDWVARGVHLPVIDARIKYRAAARFDEELEVETWIGEHTRVSVRFDYRLHRGDEVLAEGYTLLACVDDRHTPRRIPPEVIDPVLGPELAT